MVPYLVAVIISLWIYLFFVKKTTLDYLPGPKGIPFLGNILQLDLTNPHLRVNEWAQEYGAVFGLRLGGRNVVVVTGKDELYEILIKKGKEFGGRPPSARADIVSQYKDIFFTDLTDDLRWRRRIVHSFMKQFGRGMDTIETTTMTCVEELVTTIRSASGQPIDVHAALYKCFLDIICHMTIGLPSPETDRPFMRSATDVFLGNFAIGALGDIFDTFPWLSYFGLTPYKDSKVIKQSLEDLFRKWVDSTKQNSYPGGFIHRFLEISAEDKAKFDVSDDVIHAQIWQTILNSGLTSSSTISLLLHVLVFYPEVQQKLQEEVLRVVGPDHQVSLADKRRLPYHQAVLYEVARYGSIVPLAIAHATTVDTTLYGRVIPKDTVVWANLWGLHHDPEFWTEPYLFNPDRFLDHEGQLVLADHPNRKHLLPFGAGTRVCVGEVFAQTRMLLVLATLMQKFKVEPENSLDKMPSCDARLCLKKGLVMEPKPFKVRMVDM